ncbi:MAG: hypothetical protein LBD24_02665 [Spirochaetaceae bacterium]|nr:hypothetical protein [Spirochaetaceae bacterium]
MHHSEATGGLAGTVGHGPRLGCASPLTGHGVAPFGNNKRPCLKPWDTGRAWAVQAP